jgi:hypothetical protein
MIIDDEHDLLFMETLTLLECDRIYDLTPPVQLGWFVTRRVSISLEKQMSISPIIWLRIGGHYKDSP